MIFDGLNALCLQAKIQKIFTMEFRNHPNEAEPKSYTSRAKSLRMKKITLAFFSLFSSLIFAQDGISDTSFGTNGYVLINTDNGVTLDRRVQPDGTTIYIENGKFRRLTANGTPDATFGVAGAITIVQGGANYESFTVANNQITLITKTPYDTYAMGRYNFDGTVDTTLGAAGEGFVWINVGSDIRGHILSEKSPDGKIFIGGNSSTAYGSYNNYYVRRHNTDGTNDSNYNFNAYSLGINISQTSIGYYTEEFMGGLKVRPDGNAVIFGYSNFYESSSSFVSNRRATAAIVAPTGQPIRLLHSFEAHYGWKYDLAFDQDNNTYMLGGQTNFYATAAPSNSIKKFTPTGNTAMSFGTSGTLTVSLDIDATTKADFRKILIQPDGKILLAGMAVTTTTGSANQYPYLVIARYLPNGTIDTTFGTNGYMLHDIEHPNTAANMNNLTQFYASSDFSSIYVGGYNLQNAIILKYSNASMAPLTLPTFTPVAAICAGDTVAALPATSSNNITGTWSPAIIDNMASATYTFTPDAGQHAATATMSITVNQPTTATVAETACDSYTWADNGMTYTQSGTYTNVTTNAAGCTHTKTLGLTINNATSETITETACGSYTLNGTTYTASGTYTQVTSNASGCDHTITLDLTINNATSETMTETACGSYTLNGTTYTASGIYTQVTSNASGCDHTITLDLTINNATSETMTETACDSYTLNGTTYTASGIYTQVTSNASGCDHTITLDLTINNATSETMTETACDSYTLNGTTYTASGIYTQVRSNASGCDHTITLDLTINNATSEMMTETACGSYTLNGTTYTASGIYTQVTSNASGCDHTITLDLTINNATSETITETACGSYTWPANGNTYTDSGSYSMITTNPAGCTHTTTLNLTINEAATITGQSDQNLEEGSTLEDLTVSPSNVLWYANLADASVPQNPIAASTVAVNGNLYYAVNFSTEGCPSAPFAVTVTTFLGNTSFDSAQFSIYPNPTSDVVYVKYSNPISTISVVNVLGQQVLAKNIHANQGQVDLSHLNAGTYFVKVSSGEASKTLKIIKK